jgi:P27 family predicted phage terminase small subunit
MTRPGPASKPLELKVLEGNRGHRPVDLTSTFRPEVGMPTVPAGLSAGARKVWKRLAPELLRYNLMSAVYSDTFEDLCETVADVKTLRRALRARQALLVDQGKPESDAWLAHTPNGMPVQHPLPQVLRAARADMQRLLDKFGLSPAEQASVTTALRAQLQLFSGDGAAAADPAAPRAPGLPKSFGEFDD